MNRPHDMGGEPAGPVIAEDGEAEPWEKLITAIAGAMRVRGHSTVDELRRCLEDLPPEIYAQPYFERWSEAICNLFEEKGFLSRAQVEQSMSEIEQKLES